MQSLGKMVQHAPVLNGVQTDGAKIWCVFVITGRMPQSGKLPVLNLLTGQKSVFFAPQGRLIAPIHVKLGRADRHVGPLGCARFHLNHHEGVGMRPKKNKKNPLFGIESPRRDDSLDRFLKFLGAFTRLSILH